MSMRRPQPIAPSTLRDQHAEATRRTLVDEALKLFGVHGYNGTSLDDVAVAAKATKGAVYHHFKDKKQLFIAVYELMAKAVAERVAERAGLNPKGRIDRAISAFLEQTAEPDVLHILLQDGPSVLGGTTCREIDLRYGLGMLTAMLEVSTSPKLLKSVGAELMAKIMFAAVVEGSLAIGSAKDPRAEQIRVDRFLRHLFDGLTGA